MTVTALSIPGVRKPTKLCQVEKVETFNVNISRGQTQFNINGWFTGVAFLPRDRVMLVDHNNGQCILLKVKTFKVNIGGGQAKFTGVAFLPGDRMVLMDYNNGQCILLNNLHQVVTTYKLYFAFDICVVEDEELKDAYDICVVADDQMAVTSGSQTNIEILSVRDDVISPVRTITTKYKCEGIISAGNGEIVVAGCCDYYKSCFSLIRDGVEVRYSDQYDSGDGRSYIAINNSNTRVYVSASGKDCLHCFNMEGKMQYTYNPDTLKSPLGVAVDSDDNIYVVGSGSPNIHQLSPEGCNLQVITNGVPQCPRAISFEKNRDSFIMTNYENQELNIYQLK